MLCGLLCVLARDTRCCVGSCVCWLETHDVVWAPVCVGLETHDVWGPV